MSIKILIFGITGNLSRHKLLPALSRVVRSGEFDDIEIIGVSRHEVNLRDLCGDDDHLASRISIRQMNLASLEDYKDLKQSLFSKDTDQLLAYLAVPPGASASIVDFMGEVGLNGSNVKILFEKPFGVDLVSAKEFISRTARYFKEEQLYRIDHYLAKEMTQNFVTIRGRNAFFSNIWNNNFIELIEVIASESIGIEGRANFYEQTGALRDFVQGHLMQLLSLTLMDIPGDFDWRQLPELRLKAIRQILPANPEVAFRAQYKGYREEVSNPSSQTETFVSINLESTQPRWLDVPIRLISGKALERKTSEIRIHLKPVSEAQSNTIVFRIQPNEGVDIELFVKKPGYNRTFETRHLELTYPEDVVFPDAYEQVIVDAILSRKSLFASSDEILESWRILDPLQKAWSLDTGSLRFYEKGSPAGKVYESGLT